MVESPPQKLAEHSLSPTPSNENIPDKHPSISPLNLPFPVTSLDRTRLAQMQGSNNTNHTTAAPSTLQARQQRLRSAGLRLTPTQDRSPTIPPTPRLEPLAHLTSCSMAGSSVQVEGRLGKELDLAPMWSPDSRRHSDPPHRVTLPAIDPALLCEGNAIQAKPGPTDSDLKRNISTAVDGTARAPHQADQAQLIALAPVDSAPLCEVLQCHPQAPYPLGSAPSDCDVTRNDPSAVYEALTSTPFYPRPLVPPPSPGTRREVFVPGELLSEKAFAQRDVETAEDPRSNPAGSGDWFSGHYFQDLLEAQKRVRERSDEWARSGRSRKRQNVLELPPDYIPLLPASHSLQYEASTSSSRASLPLSTRSSSLQSSAGSSSSFRLSAGFSPSDKLPTVPYGLGDLPPLSPNTRPVRRSSLRNRQGQILFRPRNTSYGTDIPPQAIIPHLDAIRALRVQKTSDGQRSNLGGANDEGGQNRRGIVGQRATREPSMSRLSPSEQATQPFLRQRSRESSAVEQQPLRRRSESEHKPVHTSAREQQRSPPNSRVQTRQSARRDSDSDSTPTSRDSLVLRAEMPDICTPWTETVFEKPTSDLFSLQSASDNQASALMGTEPSKTATACYPQNTESDSGALSAICVLGSGSCINPDVLNKAGEDQSVDDLIKGTANCQLDHHHSGSVCQTPNALFPRPDRSLGRQASQPPPFQPDAEAECMRPRFQPAKFEGDLYTPAIVRAGRSSGVGDAAGNNGSKEGWCGLCPPRSESTSSQIGGWLNLRNSSYRYVSTRDRMSQHAIVC